MNQFIDKLIALEREIANEKGDFTFFALFLREEAENKWDLLISAPWIGTNKKKTLKYLASQLSSRLEEQELLSISRIVLIDESNPALDAFHRGIRVEHGMAEVKGSNFFGLQIEHAYIITSKRES